LAQTAAVDCFIAQFFFFLVSFQSVIFVEIVVSVEIVLKFKIKKL